jgi:tetratricopeptide (TPR) repeat protein
MTAPNDKAQARVQAVPQAKGRAGARTVLLAILAALVGIWIATIPLRRRLARETARYNRQAEAAQAEAARAKQVAVAARQVANQAEQARQAVAQSPNDPAKRLAYAELLAQTTASAEAEKQFVAATDLEPGAAEPRALLAEFYDHQNRLDLAIDNYKKALALDPHNVRALKGLSFRYVSLGWNQQAEALLQRAVQEQPDEVRLHVSLGLAAFQIDNMKRAEHELLEAHRLAPNDNTIYMPLIEVYRLGHRHTEALKTIDEALKVVPDRVSLLLERALIYLDANDDADLLATVMDVLNLDSGNLRAHYLRGLCLRRKGDFQSATREFEWIYARQPEFEATPLMLGQLWIQQGRTADGKRLIEENTRAASRGAIRSHLMYAVGLKPNAADAHAQLGADYLKSREYPRAIVELKRALELHPGDRQSRTLLARALKAVGRDEEAHTLGAG